MIKEYQFNQSLVALILIVSLFLSIILSLVLVVKADDSVYYTSKNIIQKDNDYKLILEQNIKNVLIDTNNLYISSNDNFYIINKSFGIISKKYDIKEIKNITQSDNFIYLASEKNIYKINKTDYTIEYKKISDYLIDSIYSFYGIQSQGITNIYNNQTYYNNYTNYTNNTYNNFTNVFDEVKTNVISKNDTSINNIIDFTNDFHLRDFVEIYDNKMMAFDVQDSTSFIGNSLLELHAEDINNVYILSYVQNQNSSNISTLYQYPNYWKFYGGYLDLDNNNILNSPDLDYIHGVDDDQNITKVNKSDNIFSNAVYSNNTFLNKSDSILNSFANAIYSNNTFLNKTASILSSFANAIYSNNTFLNKSDNTFSNAVYSNNTFLNKSAYSSSGTAFSQYISLQNNVSTVNASVYTLGLSLPLTASKAVNIECSLRVSASLAATGIHTIMNYTNSSWNRTDMLYYTAAATLAWVNTFNTSVNINSPASSGGSLQVYEVTAFSKQLNNNGFFNVSIKSETSGSNVTLFPASYCRSVEI